MDTSTIFSVQGGLLVISTAMLLVNWRMNPEVAEARLWVISLSLMLISALIFGVVSVQAIESRPGFWLFAIVANTLFATGFIVIYSGARSLSNRKPLSLNIILAVAALVCGAMIVGQHFATDSEIGRAGVSSAALGIINLATAWVLLAGPDRIIAPKALLAVLTALAGTVLSLRTGMLYLNSLGWQISEDLSRNIPYYVLTLVIPGATISFILLSVHRLQDNLRHMANNDHLTGILNRRAFHERVVPVIANARRSGIQVAVAMFDLDFFKHINDNFGHAVGDAVLKKFVDVARASLRSGDVFARYGGDEFIAVLLVNDITAAETMANRLRGAFAAAGLDIGDTRVQSTVSIGLTMLSACDDDLEAAAKRADKALYEAKKNSRNRCMVSLKDDVQVEESATKTARA
ncbi:MAG: GGDEF domain-containing protein [Halieaceae bacterium]|jgi:diguanylate cyclase (GGDEF)-like protein|nr:GGDEF domain-containing protein [Halieaceae bacterium]